MKIIQRLKSETDLGNNLNMDGIIHQNRHFHYGWRTFETQKISENYYRAKKMYLCVCVYTFIYAWPFLQVKTASQL